MATESCKHSGACPESRRGQGAIVRVVHTVDLCLVLSCIKSVVVFYLSPLDFA